MPNHCSNYLVVTGSHDQRLQFERYAKGLGPKWDGKGSHDCVFSDTNVCLICTVKPEELIEIDLNKFVPVPAEYLVGKEGKDAYNSGGYEWVSNNWGTKWGCYDFTTEHTIRKLVYYFQTAWRPFNNDCLIAMSSKFPNLKFEMKYAECGSAFYGTIVAKGGVITKDQSVSDKRPTSKLMRKLWSTSG